MDFIQRFGSTDIHIIPQEFHGKPVERYCIHILCIKNCSCQFRCKDAVSHKELWCFRTRKTSGIMISGIDFYMMFQHFKTGRDVLKFLIDFIFKLMPSPREMLLKFFLGTGMRKGFYNIFKIQTTFSFSIFPTDEQ